MASLTYRHNRAVIQWLDARDKRKTIGIAGIDRTFADDARRHVGALAASVVSGGPVPLKTAKWLAEIPDRVHAKLVAKGLTTPRDGQEQAPSQLGPFLERYIKGRTDVKARSIANFTQVKNGLVKHFGKRRDMATINRGEMGDWHRGLLAKLAPATVAMHVKRARQMFQDAVDRDLITDNPTKGIKAGSMKNEDRMVYVPEGHIEEVIAACPDAEWKLIFALARYGGIRIPSELSGLRWSRVHWDKGRFIVAAPKTAAHPGKAERTVPIFPELLPYLLSCFEAAEPGEDRVIVLHRGENLRTTAEKIVTRAGLPIWEKPFQNLRSSRETDLADSYPMHVVCDWIGNSEAVARKHYLQVKEEHIMKASGKSAAPGAAERTGKDRKSPEPEMRNPSENPRDSQDQHTPKGGRTTADFLDFLKGQEKALHQALHGIKSTAPRLRARDIRVLQRAVRNARRKEVR